MNKLCVNAREESECRSKILFYRDRDSSVLTAAALLEYSSSAPQNDIQLIRVDSCRFVERKTFLLLQHRANVRQVDERFAQIDLRDVRGDVFHNLPGLLAQFIRRHFMATF